MVKNFKSTIVIGLITILSMFLFTSAVFANSIDKVKLENQDEVKILIEKVQQGSSSPDEVKTLLEKVQQGNSEAVKWFKNLSINNPEKIKEAFNEGITVKNNETVIIDFNDGSSIEFSTKAEPPKTNINTVDDKYSTTSYLITWENYATYKYKVSGITMGYYYIWCKYGANNFNVSGKILDHWDEVHYLYPILVTAKGTNIIKDNANPVIVGGRSIITSFNSTLANIRGEYHCYTSDDYLSDNYCVWTVS
ncbi:hypothetical protein [Desulfolucanica intricata]|uniref:hypothetical protein n=1 Tax=Desulfolucanica intricata TaxID=1285191 RepID=UPI000835226B|nr:hypothetical protein [Desulfolucanica intricata]